jgi:hypothetical protein
MKSKRTLFGIGAMAIGVVISTGAGTWTFHHRRQVFNHTRHHAPAHPSTITPSDPKRLLSWLETATLPVLNDAHAVPNLCALGLTVSHPTISNASHSAMARGDTWRPNRTPVTRFSVSRVGDYLRLKSSVLPLHTQSPTASLMLPSPPLWASKSLLQGRQIDGALAPRANDAERAARTTLQLLENREALRMAQTPQLSLENVPYVNPLGWSVSSTRSSG